MINGGLMLLLVGFGMIAFVGALALKRALFGGAGA